MIIPGLLKSLSKPYVRAFNVQTLCRIEQQAPLAITRAIDVCCVSETCIQDTNTLIDLVVPCQYKELARFTFRAFEGSTATSYGLAGVGIPLSSKSEQALLV